jgi:Polyketide cyclase / dehydrase and lipid transport
MTSLPVGIFAVYGPADYARPIGWRFEQTAESTASPQAVWRRYVDVPNWRDWSERGVVWSRIDGPFEVGTKGRSKPPGLPAGSFRLVAVEPDELFASETRLPGARLRFEHVIEKQDAGVRITHRATLDGPLSSLYRPLVRRAIEQGLPAGVERLAVLAAAD